MKKYGKWVSIRNSISKKIHTLRITYDFFPISLKSFAVMLENSGGKIVLGHVTDDLARARYSMALAAQRSSSELVIQFYSFSSPDDCNTAISAKAIPTSMYTE